MKIGLIKSKIEEKFTTSYSKGTFKTEVKTFKNLVLENKSLSKLFYIYDQLSENKGYDREFANHFISETSLVFKDLNYKIDKKVFNSLNEWLMDVEVENRYQDVDNVFYNNVLNLEEKIKSRVTILENLQKKPSEKQIINIPINSMVNIANKTIMEHITSLGESEREELLSFLSQNKKDIQNNFVTLKENVITKLTVLSENSEPETKEKIKETIEKVTKENFDLANYFKLKKLNEGI